MNLKGNIPYVSVGRLFGFIAFHWHWYNARFISKHTKVRKICLKGRNTLIKLTYVSLQYVDNLYMQLEFKSFGLPLTAEKDFFLAQLKCLLCILRIWLTITKSIEDSAADFFQLSNTFTKFLYLEGRIGNRLFINSILRFSWSFRVSQSTMS